MSVSSTGRGPSAAEEEGAAEAEEDADETLPLGEEVGEGEGAAPFSPSSSSSRSGGGESALSHPISPGVYLCDTDTISVE